MSMTILLKFVSLYPIKPVHTQPEAYIQLCPKALGISGQSLRSFLLSEQKQNENLTYVQAYKTH